MEFCPKKFLIFSKISHFFKKIKCSKQPKKQNKLNFYFSDVWDKVLKKRFFWHLPLNKKQCQEYWSQIQSDLIFQIMHFSLGFWLSILKIQPSAQKICKNVFWWFCVRLLPQYWQTELTQTKRGADKNLSARLHFNNFACLYQMEVF